MSGRGVTAARVAALGTLVVSAAALGVVIRTAGIHLRKTPIYPPGNRQLSSIPAVTEHWERLGTDRVEEADVVKTLGTENYVTRNYLRKGTEQGSAPVVMEFHAAYYTGMIDTVPHVPERCFVGGGLQQSEASRVLDLHLDGASWIPDSTVTEDEAQGAGTIYTVRLANDPSMTDAPGMRVRLPRGVGPDSPLRMRCSEFLLPDGRKYYAGYFFIANGGTVANANDVRQLAFNLTDDYAYYLKVQVNTASVGSMDELAAQASSLLDELMGEVMRCVPDWVEVERGEYPADRGGAG